jgi:hypothetical protein
MATIERLSQLGHARFTSSALVGLAPLAGVASRAMLGPDAFQLGGIGVRLDTGDLGAQLEHAREVPSHIEAGERCDQSQHAAATSGQTAVMAPSPGLAVDHDRRAPLPLAARRAHGESYLSAVAILLTEPLEHRGHTERRSDRWRVETADHGEPPISRLTSPSNLCAGTSVDAQHVS